MHVVAQMKTSRMLGSKGNGLFRAWCAINGLPCVPKPKVAMACKACGSTEVTQDATVTWDVESQSWPTCWAAQTAKAVQARRTLSSGPSNRTNNLYLQH